jgi:hypothetical protein
MDKSSMDKMQSYLVTSRDNGLSLDVGWIYAKRALLPAASPQQPELTRFTNVWTFPSIVDGPKGEHHLFFVVNDGHHEKWGSRPDGAPAASQFGVAKFDHGRLSGVVAGNGCGQPTRYIDIEDFGGSASKVRGKDGGGAAGGTFLTKPFSIELAAGELPRLLLNACVRSVSDGGMLAVELVAEGQVDTPLVVSEPISGVDGGHLELKWKEGSGDKALLALTHNKDAKGGQKKHHLLFRMANAALYSFAPNTE